MEWENESCRSKRSAVWQFFARDRIKFTRDEFLAGAIVDMNDGLTVIRHGHVPEGSFRSNRIVQ
ncbi:hypothetical protein AA12467_2180 [Gluconobacter sphaericus NBRC 12467]|nr:hypothetical protein AA12467_2180 [Gluconobacter sphaericus NBRC 12467]